jgi:hypothetical protein
LYRHWGSVQAVWPIRGVEVQLYPFLTTALEGGKGSASRERPGTHCTGGQVGPRAGPDRCGNFCSPLGFDPRTVQPVASRYTDYATKPTYIAGSCTMTHCRGRNFTLSLVFVVNCKTHIPCRHCTECVCPSLFCKNP